MKRFFLFAIVIGTIIWGCNKKGNDCKAVEPAMEEDSILAFNAAHGFTAVKHPSGLYYQILDPGVGAVPTPESRVRVQYVGKLFNGTVFDSNLAIDGVVLTIPGVIEGWQIGLPLLKAGGRIRLMIPSKYAYGCRGSGATIPPNKPLFFEINLLAVF